MNEGTGPGAGEEAEAYPETGTEASYDGETGAEEAPVEVEEIAPRADGPFAALRDTRVWGLLALRGYLAFVFFQAAIGHLGQPAEVLVAQWTPGGAFSAIGSAAQQNPDLFVEGIILLEIGLAASVTIGVLTRFAGLGGFLLNGFFFLAFEWGDLSQVYLSWDAGLAALWLVVLLTGPGRYVGVGHYVARRWPRAAPWLV